MSASQVKTMQTPEFCYLKISIAGVVQKEPIVIQLNNEECPKTCQNFVALCTSPKTTSRRSPCPSYRGCEFHRIIPDFMVQGGDFERFDGKGGYSPIHEGGKFADEYLQGKHDQAGIVSMANSGKNTNKSQFFITLKATPHLDGKHVVFGKVIGNGMETVRNMLSVEREGDRPVLLQTVTICDCGLEKGDIKDEHSESSEFVSNKERKLSHEDRKRKKKRKKHSRKDDYSSSSSEDDSVLSSDDERYRRKKKSKHSRNDTTDDDGSPSYKRRKKKHKKKSRRKEHKKKIRKSRDY